MDEITEALEGLSNRNTVRPDGLPTKLLNIDHPAFAQCFHNIPVNVRATEAVPQQRKHAIIKVLHKKKDRIDCNSYRGISVFCPRGQNVVENRRVPP